MINFDPNNKNSLLLQYAADNKLLKQVKLRSDESDWIAARLDKDFELYVTGDKVKEKGKAGDYIIFKNFKKCDVGKVKFVKHDDYEKLYMFVDRLSTDKIKKLVSSFDTFAKFVTDFNRTFAFRMKNLKRINGVLKIIRSDKFSDVTFDSTEILDDLKKYHRQEERLLKVLSGSDEKKIEQKLSQIIRYIKQLQESNSIKSKFTKNDREFQNQTKIIFSKYIYLFEELGKELSNIRKRISVQNIFLKKPTSENFSLYLDSWNEEVKFSKGVSDLLYEISDYASTYVRKSTTLFEKLVKFHTDESTETLRVSLYACGAVTSMVGSEKLFKEDTGIGIIFGAIGILLTVSFLPILSYIYEFVGHGSDYYQIFVNTYRKYEEEIKQIASEILNDKEAYQF